MLSSTNTIALLASNGYQVGNVTAFCEKFVNNTAPELWRSHQGLCEAELHFHAHFTFAYWMSETLKRFIEGYKVLGDSITNLYYPLVDIYSAIMTTLGYQKGLVAWQQQEGYKVAMSPDLVQAVHATMQNFLEGSNSVDKSCEVWFDANSLAPSISDASDSWHCVSDYLIPHVEGFLDRADRLIHASPIPDYSVSDEVLNRTLGTVIAQFDKIRPMVDFHSGDVTSPPSSNVSVNMTALAHQFLEGSAGVDSELSRRQSMDHFRDASRVFFSGRPNSPSLRDGVHYFYDGGFNKKRFEAFRRFDYPKFSYKVEAAFNRAQLKLLEEMDLRPTFSSPLSSGLIADCKIDGLTGTSRVNYQITNSCAALYPQPSSLTCSEKSLFQLVDLATQTKEYQQSNSEETLLTKALEGISKSGQINLDDFQPRQPQREHFRFFARLNQSCTAVMEEHNAEIRNAVTQRHMLQASTVIAALAVVLAISYFAVLQPYLKRRELAQIKREEPSSDDAPITHDESNENTSTLRRRAVAT